MCGNGSVISSYENASAEEIACAQTLGELSYDSRGYAVWDNGERCRVVRIVNSSYDLTYYALVSDAAIAAATSDSDYFDYVVNRFVARKGRSVVDVLNILLIHKCAV